MRVARIVVILVVLLSVTFSAFAGLAAEWPPPKETGVAAAALLPPVAVGPSADLLAFPWSTVTSGGVTFRLGYGFRGALYVVPAFRTMVLSPSVFVGTRFGFSDRFSLGLETGVGALLSGSTALYATVGVAPIMTLTANWTIRVCVAADLALNPNHDPADPASSRFVLWFRLGAGVLRSIGSESLFSRGDNQDL